jgi:Glycosyl transferase family 2
MREITLCLPYYDNPGMLLRQIDMMDKVPWNARDYVRLIVVDDGSPRWPAQAFPCPVDLKIFRIEVDVRWNQDAARNIAVHESNTPWLLLTDIDHWVPASTWKRILNGSLDRDKVYRFSRVSEPAMEHYKPHPNSWLMSREVWDDIGGYDERFAGFYGTDADFRNRVQEVAEIEMLKEIIVRVPREVTPDASTTTYVRKAPEDLPGLDRVKLERESIKNWRPLTLSFPYHRVL